MAVNILIEAGTNNDPDDDIVTPGGLYIYVFSLLNRLESQKNIKKEPPHCDNKVIFDHLWVRPEEKKHQKIPKSLISITKIQFFQNFVIWEAENSLKAVSLLL